jgi:DNA-directed RNA polymerase subunit F
VLDKGLMDSGLLDGYFELAANGPQGEDLLGSGEEVLAYLDSIVSGDPRHIESFFHELFEVLSPELRVRLADILAGK